MTIKTIDTSVVTDEMSASLCAAYISESNHYWPKAACLAILHAAPAVEADPVAWMSSIDHMCITTRKDVADLMVNPRPLYTRPSPQQAITPELIKAALSKMSDSERMDIFRDYCKYCGRDDPGCQCWNDE